jgi:hypothetical protein
MDPELDSALGLLPGTTGAVDPSSAYPIAGDTGVASGTGAGAHGLWMNAPPVGQAGGAIRDGIEQLWDWLNEPFTRPLSITTIFIMVGSVLIGILVWNMILYHIRIAAESL